VKVYGDETDESVKRIVIYRDNEGTETDEEELASKEIKPFSCYVLLDNTEVTGEWHLSAEQENVEGLFNDCKYIKGNIYFYEKEENEQGSLKCNRYNQGNVSDSIKTEREEPKKIESVKLPVEEKIGRWDKITEKIEGDLSDYKSDNEKSIVIFMTSNTTKEVVEKIQTLKLKSYEVYLYDYNANNSEDVYFGGQRVYTDWSRLQDDIENIVYKVTFSECIIQNRDEPDENLSSYYQTISYKKKEGYEEAKAVIEDEKGSQITSKKVWYKADAENSSNKDASDNDNSEKENLSEKDDRQSPGDAATALTTEENSTRDSTDGENNESSSHEWYKYAIPIVIIGILLILLIICCIVRIKRKRAKKRKRITARASVDDVQAASRGRFVSLRVLGKTGYVINQFVDGSVILGRSDLCEIFLNEPSVSRQHFAIEYDGTDFYIQNLSRTNGTKLNGILLDTKRRLQQEDVITAGSVEMIVRW